MAFSFRIHFTRVARTGEKWSEVTPAVVDQTLHRRESLLLLHGAT